MPTWLKMTEHHPSHNLGAENDPGSLDATMRWQIVWPRAVAKAWCDPQFKEELMTDAPAAINKHFGFELMPHLKFEVKEADPSAQFDASKQDNVGAGLPHDPWSALPPIEVTMYLPPAPDAAIQAVAITAYEDTGRTYPFTCC